MGNQAAAKLTCPSCGGRRQVLVHVCLDRGHGREGLWRRWPCQCCGGTGTIDAAARARIEAGAALRADRLARRLSQREEADRLGMSVVALSRREQGLPE